MNGGLVTRAVRQAAAPAVRRAWLSSTSGPAAAPPRPSRFLPPQPPPAQPRGRLLPKKKGGKQRSSRSPNPLELPGSSHVTAHVMANSHDTLNLATALRLRFGAGAVQVFGGVSEGSLVPGEVGLIEGVVHLSAPATGTDAPHGSPAASAFFFTGSEEDDGLSFSSACVSVWWGAEQSFEDALLRDLRAASGRGGAASRQQQLDRMAIPRAVMKWHHGARSELERDAILIDVSTDGRSRVLDQLAFSHALQRHMKLLLLEEEMERILSSVKRIVRQGLGHGFSRLFGRLRRFLPAGGDSGARTLQRLLLMREFNFDECAFPTLSHTRNRTRSLARPGQPWHTPTVASRSRRSRLVRASQFDHVNSGLAMGAAGARGHVR